MKVIIDHALEEHMHKHHHDVLTLTLVPGGYNVGVSTTIVPKVNYRKPRHVEGFDKYQVDGFTVYIAKNVESIDDIIKFEDKKMLGVHRCKIKGVKLINDDDWASRFPYM